MLTIRASLYESPEAARAYRSGCRVPLSAADLLGKEVTLSGASDALRRGLARQGIEVRVRCFRLRGEPWLDEDAGLAAFQARLAAEAFIDKKGAIEMDIVAENCRGRATRRRRCRERALSAHPNDENARPIAELQRMARPPRSQSVRPRRQCNERSLTFESTTRTPRAPRTPGQNVPLYGDEVLRHKRQFGGGASVQMSERRLARQTISNLEARLQTADRKIKDLEQQKQQKVVYVPQQAVVEKPEKKCESPRSLEELEDMLREATKRLFAGDHRASDECEKYQQLVASHPEYQRRELEARELWNAEQAAPNARALERLRRLVPSDVATTSAADLEKRGAPPALAKRLVSKRALWLARIPSQLVAKTHHVVLNNTYDVSGLDLFELRAVYAALPPDFENDALGLKARWKEQIRDKLVAAVAQTAGHNRPHAAYGGAPDDLDLAPPPTTTSLPRHSQQQQPRQETAAVTRSGVDAAAAAIDDELPKRSRARTSAPPPSSVPSFVPRRRDQPHRPPSRPSPPSSRNSNVQPRPSPTSWQSSATPCASANDESHPELAREAPSSFVLVQRRTCIRFFFRRRASPSFLREGNHLFFLSFPSSSSSSRLLRASTTVACCYPEILLPGDRRV